MAREWASQPCYTLRRNSASTEKDLILKIITERCSRKKEIIIKLQSLINQKKLIKFDEDKDKKFDKDKNLINFFNLIKKFDQIFYLFHPNSIVSMIALCIFILRHEEATAAL